MESTLDLILASNRRIEEMLGILIAALGEDEEPGEALDGARLAPDRDQSQDLG